MLTTKENKTILTTKKPNWHPQAQFYNLFHVRIYFISKYWYSLQVVHDSYPSLILQTFFAAFQNWTYKFQTMEYSEDLRILDKSKLPSSTQFQQVHNV